MQRSKTPKALRDSDSTPTALKLANELLDGMSDEHWSQLSADAAAELRRLHEENERLRNTLRVEELLSFRRQMQQYATQVEKDEALLRQAVEKLENLRVTIDSEWGECRDLEQIDAEGDQWPVVIALRERLGENT